MLVDSDRYSTALFTNFPQEIQLPASNGDNSGIEQQVCEFSNSIASLSMFNQLRGVVLELSMDYPARRSCHFVCGQVYQYPTHVMPCDYNQSPPTSLAPCTHNAHAYYSQMLHVHNISTNDVMLQSRFIHTANEVSHTLFSLVTIHIRTVWSNEQHANSPSCRSQRG